MSDPKVVGKVSVIEETKTYGQKGFRKRLVVLEQDNGRFTNHLPMDFIQDSCDDADELSIGQQVEITYRLSGRKWQRDEKSEVKYFLSAEALSFRVLGDADAGGSNEDPGPSVSDEEVPF